MKEVFATDDQEIVDLYWSRSERAISETDDKYGSYCHSIAYGILANNEDAEECVSDTYLAAWNAMPPRRPSILATFLGKITRCNAIDRWRSRSRQKRGSGEITLALEELEECVPDSRTIEKAYAQKQLSRVINCFLDGLPETQRRIFLCRYWYLDSISQIAGYYGFSNSKVTSMLHRMRGKLREVLEQEGLL